MERDIRIITLGETGVGKTSIINRICLKTFNIDESSSGATSFQILTKDYKKKNMKMNLYFIDTVGQEKFINILPRQYIRNSHIVLLIYSNENNFETLKGRWFKFYKENCDINKAKFLVVANKSDIFDENREEIIKLGESFAEDIDGFFMSCSAKNRDNIDNLVNHITTESKRIIDELEKNPCKNDDYISLKGVSCKRKRCCK